MHYSHVTRQYTARHLALPDLWEGSPFILTQVCFLCITEIEACSPILGLSFQDRPLLGLSHIEESSASNESGTHVPPASVRPVDLSLDTTRYRYKSRKGVEIKITPLILPAAYDFELDMETDVSIKILKLTSFLFYFSAAPRG